MLPSHLLDPNRTTSTRLGAPPGPPPPSLCVTGAMSRIGRYQVKDDVNGNGNTGNNNQPIILSYIIFRPRQLHDTKKPPLLCIHGGPSIPSTYLLPIVNGVIDRAIIFFDQYGCGKSSRPERSTIKSSLPPFSIPMMVEHLRQLITNEWKLQKYHILGHSFGGILAYEYLKTIIQQNNGPQPCCRHESVCSLILSSSPTSAEIITSESKRLYQNLVVICGGDKPPMDQPKKDDDSSSESETTTKQSKQENESLESSSQQFSEEFRQTHECRLPAPPLALMDAMAQAGPVPWRGIQAIPHYRAEGSISAAKIPTLLIRGQYDFCTDVCMEGWKQKIVSQQIASENDDDETTLPQIFQTKIVPNCSHYTMLEDERLYGKEITSFLLLCDPK